MTALPGPRPLVPFLVALPLAAAAGPLLDLAFPDVGAWYLLVPVTALILALLVGRRAGSALLLGFITGLGFFLSHVSWTALYLGPVPWAALSVLQALFFAVGALLITLAYRWTHGRTRLFALVPPLLVAALWTGRELVTGTWPYGGFAWGRLAHSQSESPLAEVVAWVGPLGLSFLLVVVAALLVETVRGGARRALPRAVLAVVVAGALVLVPAWPVITEGTLRVASVQGNGPAGYFDKRSPGDVLDAQIAATFPLRGTDPDLIVWPENGSDLNPLAVPRAAETLDLLSREIGAPLLVGTITGSEDELRNSSLLWRAGEGAVAQYDKRRPVPFGEYVPDRDFWEPLAPDLIGLIARDYAPGTLSPVIDLDGVAIGASICFDIVDDDLARETVREGARIIIAQTNNADFGKTDENEQQMAMTRLRAIETGRSIVSVSTVGRSETIGPDGRTLQELTPFESGQMVVDVPLSSVTTPAVAFGGVITQVISVAGGVGLVLAGLFSRRRRRVSR